MSAIPSNLQAIKVRVAQACQTAQRNPAEVRLIAVSKTFPFMDVLEAIKTGQTDFGENYVQEGIEKILRAQSEVARTMSDCQTDGVASSTVPKPLLRPSVWHFIGPIQSNKTRAIAEHFDWVHSVDRFKIAERLSAQRPLSLKPLNVLIQVNISHEASKSGVIPAETEALARQIGTLPRLKFCGLMAIPEPAETLLQQRKPFTALRQLAAQITAKGLPCPELSMGMSADIEAAVMEGATMVRVGMAIFGRRL